MSAEGEKMEADSQVYVPGPGAVDISPNQDKGVLKEIITTGQGDEVPGKGNKVSVHYTGKLLDGTKFDSSVERGELFEFTLGNGEVIRAWDIGVATMKKGEKCILTCHSDYAYGNKGSPPKIPADATLVFEVELFSWKLEDLSPDEDNGILRSILVEGEGFATPGEGSNVEVHLVGKFDNKQFEDRDVKFELGDGCEVGVVDGLETALKKFKKGEKSKIILSPKYAFGSFGNAELNIPPNATVEYEVTLKTFEKEKDSWNMSIDEKIEQSEIVKNKGTNYFKDGKFEIASKQYKKVINFLQFESDVEGDNKVKKDSLLSAGYLNLAACYLKLEKYEDVIQNCEKALEMDSKNTKGLFRKGQAHLALKDYEQAKECFLRVLETDSTNKAAQKNVFICKDYLKKQLEKEKKMYQNIFKKMAEQNVDGKFEIASKQYKKVINFLQFESDVEGDNKVKKDSLLSAGYLNLAACYLKLEKYEDVIQNCEKALEMDSKNTKGLFRKGQAHLALKDYEQAKECFLRVLETDSTNKAAQKNVFICKDYLKKQLEKEKKMYQNIFKKMAEQNVEPDSTTGNTHSQENGIEKMETDDEKQAAGEAVEV